MAVRTGLYDVSERVLDRYVQHEIPDHAPQSTLTQIKDFTIYCGEHQHSAHRYILVTRSSYFQNVLTRNPEANTHNFPLEFDEVFSYGLRVMYGNSIAIPEDKVASYQRLMSYMKVDHWICYDGPDNEIILPDPRLPASVSAYSMTAQLSGSRVGSTSSDNRDAEMRDAGDGASASRSNSGSVFLPDDVKNQNSSKTG